jgi:hypothetical protein
MTALTKDRPTPEREGRLVADPLAVGATIFAGSLYMLDAAGDAVPAAPQVDATTLVVRAVARKRAVQAQGDVQTDGALGVFCFDNATAGDALARTDIGALCYALDDATVAKGHDTNKRPKAGVVVDVDSGGVWVRVGA